MNLLKEGGAKTSTRSPAKINLFLHLLGKRADNYHNLQTCFVLMDWYDVLSIGASPTDKDQILASGAFATDLPAEDAPHHLLRRVLELMRRQTDIPIPPVRIELEKNIPVAAGLGGSSGNAAHLILLLNNLLELKLSQETLLRLAGTLGSDIPLFILGHHALAEGRGDELIPLPVVKHTAGNFRYLLICPQLACSTQQQFSLVTTDHYAKKLELSDANLPAAFWLEPAYHNPFLSILRTSSPKFNEFYRLICGATPGKVGERLFLSGSGGCLFAAYSDSDRLEEDAAGIKDQIATQSPLSFVTKACSPI